MSDPVVMELGVHSWPLRPFLDKLRHLTRMSASTEAERKLLPFAWVTGHRGLFLATREVLSRLYGEATVQNIVKSIGRESHRNIAWL